MSGTRSRGRAVPAIGKHGQHGATCDVDLHLRFRPDVMRSGFGGGVHPGGGTGRCRLVPSPIDPGCWRIKPDVSAWAAPAALAPPRIRLIRSRRRLASSKSRLRAAVSILRRRSSIASVTAAQRTSATLGGIVPRTRRLPHDRAISAPVGLVRRCQRGAPAVGTCKEERVASQIMRGAPGSTRAWWISPSPIRARPCLCASRQ